LGALRKVVLWGNGLDESLGSHKENLNIEIAVPGTDAKRIYFERL